MKDGWSDAWGEEMGQGRRERKGGGDEVMGSKEKREGKGETHGKEVGQG